VAAAECEEVFRYKILCDKQRFFPEKNWRVKKYCLSLQRTKGNIGNGEQLVAMSNE